MKKIHRLWLMAFAASVVCQIWVFGAEDENDAVRLFKEYLHLDGLLAHQHQAERQPPPHVIEDIKKQRDGIAQELLRNQGTAGPALAREYEESRGRGGAEMPTQLLNFAMQTGIAKPEFLGFAREVVRATDLDAPRDPQLSTALEYLGEHGEEEDLDLMVRLDGHVNQTYAQIRDRHAARLKARLSKGADKGGEDAPMPQAGPGVAGRDGSVKPAEVAQEAESPSASRWLYAVLPVVVLAVAVLLVRILNRNRRSGRA